MLRVSIASIQNVERSILLLVVSASDIPLSALVQLNYFLFSSLRRIRPCCRPSQTNMRWCVADCVIYTAWSSVTVFVTSQFARPAIDRQPVVRGRLCHIISFVVGKCLALRTSSNLRQPAVRPESRFLPIPHLHSTPLLGGFRRNIATPFVWKNQNGVATDDEKKCRRYVYSF